MLRHALASALTLVAFAVPQAATADGYAGLFDVAARRDALTGLELVEIRRSCLAVATCSWGGGRP